MIKNSLQSILLKCTLSERDEISLHFQTKQKDRWRFLLIFLLKSLDFSAFCCIFLWVRFLDFIL